MLKIAVLGIGNAGNQVANVAVREGIPSFCINASEKDLDAINKDIDTFIVGNREGAGKDRRIAKGYVKQYYQPLLESEEFDAFIDDADIVFVVSSTGGGTGSGMSVLMADILSHKYEGKIFITVGILPILNDSIGAQRNTLEYLKELKGLGKSYMLYDNNKYKELSPNAYMTKINEEIIDTLKYIRGDYSFRTSYGMIDDADMVKLFTVPGMITMVTSEGFQEKDMEDDTKLDSLLVKAMKANGVCNIDMSRVLKRLGVIVNLEEEMTKYYDPSLTALESFAGEPFESFEHYYVIEDGAADELKNRIAVILAGLSIPNDRITLIVQRIDEAEKALSRQEKVSVLDKIDSLDKLTVNSIEINRDKRKEKKNLDSITDDIFSKY